MEKAKREKCQRRAVKKDPSLAGFTYTELVVLKNLERKMNKKGYKDPTISLVGLSDALGTNRTYLSDIVHKHYGKSFSDYINSLRIEEAIKMLQETKGQMMVYELYKELGYKSATSFYRNFRKITGLSTTEWIAANIKAE